MQWKFFAMGLVGFSSALVFACGGPQKEALHPDPEPGEDGGVPQEPSPAASAPASATSSTGASPSAPASATPSGTAPRSAGEPGRSLTDIQTIITGRREEARGCYDAAQKVSPTLEGDVKLTWLIDPKGVVTEAAVVPAGSTMFDPGMNTCLESFVKKIKFNESGKGLETRASYIFNFHPKQFVKKP